MNIARLREMASAGDMSADALRFLLDCHGECEHLDFKVALRFTEDHQRAAFCRDVVAMKNVGGGYIVVGVTDKDWIPAGLEERVPLDTKEVRDLVRKVTGLTLAVDIVHHELVVGSDTVLLAIIMVRGSVKHSKLRTPSIVSRSFHPTENWGLREGDIFIRDGDSTKRLTTTEQFVQLLDQLEGRHQEISLEYANAMPSPFAIDSGFYRLLPREYEAFIGRESYKLELLAAVEKDPRIWIINLHGPGGVGKSALATWLAYLCYSESRFEAILQLSAKSVELAPGAGMRHLRPTLVSLEDLLDRVLHLFDHAEVCSADLDERKALVAEILCAFKTLLILDNMETVNDGRIMEFVRGLPPGSLAKVLLTSRQRTSHWEYPIRVAEFNREEVRSLLAAKSRELHIGFPYDDADVVARVAEVTGGLPLAIGWTLGEYARTKNLEPILKRAVSPDSPLLEFSFRNSWSALDDSSRQALAVLSIFDDPPTAQTWRTALDWPVDRMERALASLIEMTFVTERTDSRTGAVVYIALPITLSFARNELASFVGLEHSARLRHQDLQNRLQLTTMETEQYSGLFLQYGVQTETQKKAIVLSRMAEGQARSLGYDAAEQYFKQALETDPHSVYALVSYGLLKLELRNYGEALSLINEAEKHCTERTAFNVFFNKARVYDAIRDRPSRIHALTEALKHEPGHVFARHSLGVALSQSGRYEEALDIFDAIIREQLAFSSGPGETLLVAIKTKAITLRKMGRASQAKEEISETIDALADRPNCASLAEEARSILAAEFDE